MSKLLVDVNDDDLAVAAHKLGTTTKKDTINEALARIAKDTAEEEAELERFMETVRMTARSLAEIPEEEMWR